MLLRKQVGPAQRSRLGLRAHFSSASALNHGGKERAAEQSKRPDLSSVPSLREFMAASPSAASLSVPLPEVPVAGRVFIETYGCQQNSSDTEIILSLLAKEGYVKTEDMNDAELLLTNTCAIRDNAERKVWAQLDAFKAAATQAQARLKKKARLEGEQARRMALEEEANQLAAMRLQEKPVIGVLGCMAERLKGKLLEAQKGVDLVVGPDQYRQLPSLINAVKEARRKEQRQQQKTTTTKEGQAEGTGTAIGNGIVSTALSYDEHYADIAPLREDPRKLSAYLSIQRGCNSMCSFCIVPHTRGREKARPVASIEDEVRRLRDEGYREITLLGQTVNTYWDQSTKSDASSTKYTSAAGFSNTYKLRDGEGVRFTELLDRLSLLAPSIRFRFTSPHPKDFPSELIQLIAERPNVSKQIHLPAQSGSSRVLQTMRRGYTREAFLALAHSMRATIPGLALSTDIIAGFCGETEEDHSETLSLMDEVKFEGAFMFAYSLRERTHAYYKMKDDVPEETKRRRLTEVIAAFHKGAMARNQAEVGNLHVVLVEGPARRSTPESPQLSGKSDNFKTTILVPSSPEQRLVAAASTGGGNSDGNSDGLSEDQLRRLLVSDASASSAPSSSTASKELTAGDFVVARVVSAGPTSLRAVPLLHLSRGIVDPALALLPPKPFLK